MADGTEKSRQPGAIISDCVRGGQGKSPADILTVNAVTNWAIALVAVALFLLWLLPSPKAGGAALDPATPSVSLLEQPR